LYLTTKDYKELYNFIIEKMEIEDSGDVRDVKKSIGRRRRNPMDIKDQPHFKKKIAKGSNPLSCKKKKKKSKKNIV